MKFSEDTSARATFKDKSSALVCQICGQSVAVGAAKTDGNGKAIHEECYALKVNSEKASLDGPAHSTRPWQDIAAEVTKEQDPKKMTELVVELNEALDEQTLDGAPKVKPDGKPEANGK